MTLVEAAADTATIPQSHGQPYPTACTECQRRKQKCSRVWPCDRCLKRKVAETCRFPNETALGDGWKPVTEVSKTRKRTVDHKDTDGDAGIDLSDDGEGLEAIGYGVHHLLSNLGAAVEPRQKSSVMLAQYSLQPEKSLKLERALAVLPAKDHIDLLIQNFLDTVNYYYYIAYPPKFLAEYHQWWRDRTSGRPLGLPWTCLLIMVCACSAQHATVELGGKLEADLGRTPRQLAELYHDAARELHSVIPVGQSHIYTVQYLLHSCYWFKAEARFVECWNILGAAIREGQMLGLHQDSSTSTLSEYDIEMHRRLWCILDAWDWLVSALLQRPMLIDRADCDAKQPALSIEDYPTSPLLHIRLQSILVTSIFKRFGPPKNIQTMADISDYLEILEAWMATFPPEFYFDDPDTSHEVEYPWIALHRHYLHTTALSMALGPLRAFMAKPMTTASTPAIELKYRSDGVSRAIALMRAVHAFLDYVWERDTTFHFVPFCIFDTAALLSSSVLHDDDGSIPRKQDILDSISQALSSLKKLSTATNTAKTPYDILRRLAAKVDPDMAAAHQALDERRKRHKAEPHAQALPPSPAATNSDASPAQSSQAGQFADPDWSTAESRPMSKFSSPNSRDGAIQSSSSGGNFTESVTSFDDASYLTSESAPEHLDSAGQYGAGQGQEVPEAMSNGLVSCTIPGSAGDQLNQAFAAPDDTMNLSFLQYEALPPQMPSSMYEDIAHIPQPSLSPPMDEPVLATTTSAAGTDFAAMPEAAHLGDLAELWNWQSLDLDFTENPMLAGTYLDQYNVQ